MHNEALIDGINRKESAAFAKAYLLLRKEMVFYAGRLFSDSGVEGEDIVQDIFVSIWEKGDLRFADIGELKAYVYASVRNRFKNNARHLVHVERHKAAARLAEHSAVADMAETEVFSILSRSEKLLPAECARVFKLHIEGWSVKEIAEKLNKSENTVYHQRAEALKILRKKLSETDFGAVLIFYLFI